MKDLRENLGVFLTLVHQENKATQRWINGDKLECRTSSIFHFRTQQIFILPSSRGARLNYFLHYYYRRVGVCGISNFSWWCGSIIFSLRCSALEKEPPSIHTCFSGRYNTCNTTHYGKTHVLVSWTNQCLIYLENPEFSRPKFVFLSNKNNFFRNV